MSTKSEGKKQYPLSCLTEECKTFRVPLLPCRLEQLDDVKKITSKFNCVGISDPFYHLITELRSFYYYDRNSICDSL